ncbi:MAG: hypothetical protein IJ011_07740 [Clostridia bacterium]|nr:hypothetical protein [Clostridia bacterium]
MFEVGSHVIYRAEGVCVIVDIREESFGAIGEKNKYYILSPIGDEKSTVFVPVDNEKLCSMIRRLLSADEIMELAASLREERIEWIPDSRGRNLRYKEIFALGDRRDIMVLANTILSIMREGRSSDKRLTGTDENALRRAKRMLYDEFSATTDIRTEDDVFRLLEGELVLSSKQKYM